jgi:hypothetical protein
MGALRSALRRYQFGPLDGSHPWAQRVPEGAVTYSVRQLEEGHVSYFNFTLAKEMGLLPEDHPHEMNPELQQEILRAFNLRIINEWDIKYKKRYPPHLVKPGRYMATRYLQLQHPDKAGRTSGDGRCIWNGQVKHKGRTWDVSSRGTGVTCLAPGAVLAGRPLRSGSTTFGYGCGMADLDELYGAAILSEIFHNNGLNTERMLAVIDSGNGLGIGVRAAPNMIRPAHLFSFLRQGRREPLARALRLLCHQQQLNGRWAVSRGRDAMEQCLDHLAVDFARFAAHLEREYIFAWLEWDGDNVLADAGIIDYGSVRQFGLRHEQYRYDDVDRVSTNLQQQRQKARDIVQTFVQCVDFIKTGKRKSFSAFTRSPYLSAFDSAFHEAKHLRLLTQMGFEDSLARVLWRHHRKDVERFCEIHSELERAKTQRRTKRVADGWLRPAIFNMRSALRQMPAHLEGLPKELVPLVDPQEMWSWIISSQASRQDKRLTRRRRQKLTLWQERYLRLVRRVTTVENWGATVQRLRERSNQINVPERLTGNALIHVVDELLRRQRKGMSRLSLQRVIDNLILRQSVNFTNPPSQRFKSRVLQSLWTVVTGFREDI